MIIIVSKGRKYNIKKKKKIIHTIIVQFDTVKMKYNLNKYY
jgi:hypothetical protein